MSFFLRKHKTEKILLSTPETIYILQKSPTKEKDFITWTQELSKFDLEVKFIKPSNLYGIFNLMALNPIRNIFKVSSLVLTLKKDSKYNLFKQYSEFLSKNSDLFLIKNKKIKIVFIISKGQFFHAKSLDVIKNYDESLNIKKVVNILNKPLLKSLKVLNLPFYKLLLVLKNYKNEKEK